MPKDGSEGWHGWDDYAAFYDWENARTVGRRDIAFWQRLVEDHGGPVLELGCGSGRGLVPVARSGESVVGLDRSDNMLALAQRRVRRAKVGASCVQLVRGDIRALPFSPRHRFRLVIAPYGVLQSLLHDRDLRRTLVSVRDVLRPGGLFAVDLVPDLPGWEECERRVSLRGRRPGGRARITLIEAGRPDRARGLTIFDQEFIERRGSQRTVHEFSLTFRTLSVPQMVGRLRRAGFRLERLAGDYVGGSWHPEAETWLVLAHRPD